MTLYILNSLINLLRLLPLEKTDNGNLSETFHIERSTRQGDPISPLIFILGLEILFITLRSDENIKGIKIENNELKLTAYADDASYFMKDIVSAENLLKTIKLFSKTSGLEVNRSKSECLLLSFEMGLNEYSEHFSGIPVVQDLKVLGHYFGKNNLICNFQNFYRKLETMSKLFNIWRQRSLTIMGKNLLINSLSTSLFLFNSQIEIPPIDFVKSVEKVHKDFLWSGGTPKIAHHTLIAEYEKGGIKYKDLNSFIAAINIKFIHNISCNPCSGNALLPNLWITKLFKIPTNTEERGPYFYNYFSDVLNILNCNFKLPRKIKYKGHPF